MALGGPAKAEPAAARAVAIWAETEQRILTLLAQRAVQGVGSAAWAQGLADRLPGILAEVRLLLAHARTASDRAVLDGLVTAWLTGDADTRSFLLGLGIEPGPPSTGQHAIRAVLALATDTQAGLHATSAPILRSVHDTWRELQRQAAGQVLTGAVTQRQAAAEVVARAAAIGLTGFTDRNGRRWSPETWADMSTRSAVGRAYGQATVARLVSNDIRHGQVSDIPGECARCRPYEGKVLSLTATDLPPADGGSGRYAGTLAHAHEAGFQHPGCRHVVNGYLPGFTRPPDRPTPDRQGEKDRQRLRSLERDVRRYAGAENVARAAGDPATTARYRRLAADARGRIVAHTNDTGLLRQRHREVPHRPVTRAR